jgi:hypothetical protein
LAVSRSTLFQGFKYVVYIFLAMNVYWFFAEEFLANKLLYPDGVSITDLVGAYAATVDTAAWVVLLLMFELETYILEDRHFTTTVNWALRSLRAVCYVFIVSAFLGYIETLVSVQNVSPLPGISNLCALVADQWSYSYDLEEYAALTLANCNSFSSATTFIQFHDAHAVVDAEGLQAIIGLAWIDVVNGAVWLLVVLVLEIDVWLQENNRYEGPALRISTIMKVILYATLLYAAVYWGLKGDFVDFWDAFLWLVAFVFIELNVFEWRQESHEELAATASGQNFD